MKKYFPQRILWIEGDERVSGPLLQGFHKLLARKLSGHMPRIKLGGSGTKGEIIRKFLACREGSQCYLLLDLDAEEDQRAMSLRQKNISGQEAQVFFMIQAMEAWFISQKEVLDSYYEMNVSRALPGRPAAEILRPKEELRKATRKARKGEYEEIRDGAALLERLNPDQLAVDFPDFARLIQCLS